MVQLRLQRSLSARGEHTVYGSDWDRFCAVRNPLRDVLAQCLGLGVENAFDLGNNYLGIRFLRPYAQLSHARTGPPDYEAALERLYIDLKAVCSATEQCRVDPETECITLPGTELTVLGTVKYESVIRLLDALAVADTYSTAPLTWRIKDKDHVLKVSGKARLRAIGAQALWISMKGDSDSEPTTQGENPDGDTPLFNVDNGDDAGDDNFKTEEAPVSYVVKELLSDSVFIDSHDVTIVLKGLSIAGAKVGDTILLHGWQMVPTDNYHTMTADSVEIQSQGKLGFG